MGSALTTLGWIAPDGPLHPDLLVTGVVAGLGAAAVAGRNGTRWLLITLSVAAVIVPATQGDVFRAAFGVRDNRPVVVAITAAVIVVGPALRLRWSTAVVGAIGACAGVWAVVPDTEVPLIAGAVLVGAGAVRCLPGWLPDERRRLHGIVLLLPVVSAAAGSIGRTERFEPALGVGVVVALLSLAAVRLVRAAWTSPGRGRSRQWAGTPTTVARGSTSSITTAPAPTTAP